MSAFLPHYPLPPPQFCSSYPQLSWGYSLSYPPFRIVVYSENDVVSESVARHHKYEEHLTQYMTKVLQVLKGGVLLDFGANLGWYTLTAASRGHPTISIEAIPCNHWALSESVKINGFEKLITLHNIALASNSTSSSSSSICLNSPSADEHNLGNSMLEMKTLTAGSTADCPPGYLVPLSPLHRLIPRDTHIGFMKADCEGCEASVLLSSRELFFSSSAPCALLMEVYFPHMRNFGGGGGRGGGGESVEQQLAAAGSMLLKAGYVFVDMTRSARGGYGHLVLIEPTSKEFQTLFQAESLKNLLAVLTTERCFPRGGSRWTQLFSSSN
jgi:FkbM family methyltransferase